MAKRKLHTRICDVLEIEYPIIQAGMGGFSDPPLVIAVSEGTRDPWRGNVRSR
jgi:NAD(P)H-dependent flavin oxidoreductase YrpB (nitropropane dioxygenase family)